MIMGITNNFQSPLFPSTANTSSILKASAQLLMSSSPNTNSSPRLSDVSATSSKIHTETYSQNDQAVNDTNVTSKTDSSIKQENFTTASAITSSPVASSPTSPTSSSTTVCANCGTSKTPLWRRTPDGLPACNACGLYYKANNTHRPVNLKRPPTVVSISDKNIQEGSCQGDSKCNGTGGTSSCKGCPAFNNRVVVTATSPSENSNNLSGDEHQNTSISNTSNTDDPNSSNSLAVACSNCGTTITPLWRRDAAGNTICNACGLYYKMHGSHRPVVMKKATIKRRKRNMNENNASSEFAGPEGALENNSETSSKKKNMKKNRLSAPVTITMDPIPTERISLRMATNANTQLSQPISPSLSQISNRDIINRTNSPLSSSILPPPIRSPGMSPLNSPIIQIPSLTSAGPSHPKSTASYPLIALPRIEPGLSFNALSHNPPQLRTLPPIRFMSPQNIAVPIKSEFTPPAIDFTSTFMRPQTNISETRDLKAELVKDEHFKKDSDADNDSDTEKSNSQSTKMSVSVLLNETNEKK